MSVIRASRIPKEIALRASADALMTAVAVFGGLLLRLVWLAGVEGNVTLSRALFMQFARTYGAGLVILLPLSLVIFSLSGFYTHGRVYRSPYKALVIAQAVSLSYLLFSLVDFLFPNLLAFPREALLTAWALSLLFLLTARLWSVLWAPVIRLEDRLYAREARDRRVERVLVIGGAGYIGSALLPKLLAKGYQVRLLDLLLFGTEPIAGVLEHPNLEVVQADFRQVDRVVQAMRDVDAVIHLGAIVGDPACALDEELTIEINLMATRMIAEVAKGCALKRFVFASTCSVYGASDELLDERSALNPVSLYARSKIASERVLLHMADERFTPVILRFGTIYGLSGRTRFDLVVNLFAAKAVVEGQISVFGGDQWRPFVHVDDAALALFKALEAPEPVVNKQIFNVGSNAQNYTIQQVAELVQRRIPGAQLVSNGSDTDRRNYRVSFGKIRERLDFAPQWTVEQGVDQVVQAIRSGRVKDYQDARYSNVKYLRASSSAGRIRRQNGWAHELLNETAPVQTGGETVQTDGEALHTGGEALPLAQPVPVQVVTAG